MNVPQIGLSSIPCQEVGAAPLTMAVTTMTNTSGTVNASVTSGLSRKKRCGFRSTSSVS